jgi:CelD/BcsL family acetyltransferase involved in cellulose biosynthesis
MEPDADGFEVVVARTEAEVEDLRGAWQSLQWNPLGDIDFFLNVTWVRAPKQARPHVVMLVDGGAPVAVLAGRVQVQPMPVRFGYRTLFTVRGRQLRFVYGGAMGKIGPDEARLLVSEAIGALDRGEADVAMFDHLPLDGDLIQAVTELVDPGRRDRTPKVEPHLQLDLPASYEGVLASLSASARRNEKRYTRLVPARHEGRWRVDLYESAADHDAVLGAMQTVSAKSYHRGLDVGFRDDDESRMVLRTTLERGLLKTWVLSIDDLPVAYWNGWVYRGCYWGWATGFDPEFAKDQVGVFLFARMLSDLCEMPDVERLDFGFGEADWKLRYPVRRWEEATVNVFANRLSMRWLRLSRAVVSWLDRMSAQLLRRTGLWERVRRAWRRRLTPG